MTTDALQKGAVIGILGGGQLGRMLAQAARQLGFQTHIFTHKTDIANRPDDIITCADWQDETALAAFADHVDIVSFEFENIPPTALNFLAQKLPVRPNIDALDISRDRLLEKNFMRGLGLGVADFVDIDKAETLHKAWQDFGGDAILKTRLMGYDGKGQWRLDKADTLALAIEELAGQPAIVEAVVPFDCEISVIAARGMAGDKVCYDCSHNVHENHILRHSLVPTHLPDSLQKQAQEQAAHILTALNYVGVLAVEFFVCGDRLLVNEIAPRVHNSGHWTQNACTISQFEQHIRAIAGWPLGQPVRHCDAIMTNVLGDEINAITALMTEESGRNGRADGQDDEGDSMKNDNGLKKPARFIHLYGKTAIRSGRKMGHINRLYPHGQRPHEAPGLLDI